MELRPDTEITITAKGLLALRLSEAGLPLEDIVSTPDSVLEFIAQLVNAGGSIEAAKVRLEVLDECAATLAKADEELRALAPFASVLMAMLIGSKYLTLDDGKKVTLVAEERDDRPKFIGELRRMFARYHGA